LDKRGIARSTNLSFDPRVYCYVISRQRFKFNKVGAFANCEDGKK